MNVIRWLKHPWVVVGLLVLAAVGAFFGWGWYQQSLAEQHLQRARQAIVNQNLPLAKEELLTSLSYRESKTAHLLLARALWQIGLPSEAETHLKKARPEAGTSVEYQLEQFLFRAQRGETDDEDMIASLERYISENRPEAPICREALCRGAMLNQKLERALQILLAWRANGGEENLQYHLCLGLLHQEVAQYRRAGESFEKIVKRAPKYNLARLGLAETLKIRELFSKALPHYQFLINNDFRHKLVLLGLADCYLGLDENLDLAEKYCKEQLQTEPENPIAIRLLGQIALKQNRLDQAETYLREAVRLSPGDTTAHYQLIQCLKRSGKDLEREQKKFDEISALNKRFNQLNRNRLQAKDKDLPDIYCEMGELLLKSADAESALPYLFGALSYDPNHLASRRLLYKYYVERGDLPNAQEQLRYIPEKERNRLTSP